MKLITEVPLPKDIPEISYGSSLMFIGSCFASNVGEKFSAAKFDVSVNPFGVLFNPFSVLDSMDRIVERRYFSESDFFRAEDGSYLSLSLHGDFRFATASEGAAAVNALIDTLYERLFGLTHVFYTFGTSQVFRYRPTGEICANCHKIPQKEFSKESMTAGQITNLALSVGESLRSINPDVNIVYTVSPVRYLNEGPLGANAGKGRLFCAIEDILERSGAGNYYFPAYEIVMDELRDYRYFAGDMVHPNSLAVDYIWEKICSCMFGGGTLSVLGEVERIERDCSHRPFNPSGTAYRDFCRAALERIASLEERFPRMDFGPEKNVLRTWAP